MSYFITKNAEGRVHLEHRTPTETLKWPAILTGGSIKPGETIPCDAGYVAGDVIINWALDGTAVVHVNAMAVSTSGEAPDLVDVDLAPPT